jgi:hypothetical protein
MHLAKLWVHTFAAWFLAFAGAMTATLLTIPFYGDLTRTGLLSEDDYGWQAEQPQIDPTLLHSVAVDQADVLVIGDSFSLELIWQAQLVKAGHRVATLQWDETGPLCDDLDDWLRAIGWSGRWLIIQSVERELADRLQASFACRATRRFTPNTVRSRHPPLTSPPTRSLNWRGSLTTGIRTWWNSRRSLHASPQTIFGEKVRVAPVDDGCRRFSHRACERAPFYAVDLERPALTPETAQQMESFVRRHASARIVWLVIPNKSSVYLQPERSAAFGAALQRSGTGPDLFEQLTRMSVNTPDVYLANDTHLSTLGFSRLGSIVVDWTNP